MYVRNMQIGNIMKGKPLYQKIFEDILEEIETGKYLPGDKLLSEKELAEKYGVSRITSKQALEMLAIRGIVIRKTGLGSFVLDQSEREMASIQTSQKVCVEEKEGSATIAVIFDSFDYSFGCELLKSIEWECDKNNISMYFKCTFGDIEKEKKAIEEALKLHVLGIIIMCVQNEIFNDKILRCSIDQFPVVLLDRTMAGVAIPCVTTDNYKATKELTDYLFQVGHRNICFVSHINHETPTIKARFGAFIDSNLEHNIIINEEKYIRNLKSCTPTGEIGIDREYAKEDEDRIIEYIKKNPTVTAFLATQYVIGMIVFKAIKKLGLNNKIQVVFFDGPEDALQEDGYFTRIIQGEASMGSTAVKLLMDKIDGKPVEGTVFVPYTMVASHENPRVE